MMEVRGTLEATGRRIAVVASRFNRVVVDKLVEGALACLGKHGVAEDDVVVAWVPGAFEIPLAAKALAASGRYDAVVCVGAVIRGETAHFDYVAGECARGLQQVMLNAELPVTFGVLATDTMDQALSRAGGKHGNRGWEAAMAAIEMCGVIDDLPSKD
jgi:6,7-dimethyl-8-ribityllumazine synthase